MLMDSRLYREEMKKAEPVVQSVGEGIGFERIRRITGYLVGSLERFNNAKRAEEHDRLRHSFK